MSLKDKALGYKNREKIIGAVYLEEDVKQAVKELKEEFRHKKFFPEEIQEIINKIFGDFSK